MRLTIDNQPPDHGLPVLPEAARPRVFDRPFKPDRPIFGMVRPRTTQDPVSRLDVAAYRRSRGRPARANPPRVAVIGAGMAGLACARRLADHGLPVTVLDKGRSPAGRMSTRRIDGLRFDHGAQYFTARDDRFAHDVRSWVQDGIVAPWQGRIVRLTEGSMEPLDDSEERCVGTPSMSMVAKYLAAGLDVRCGIRIDAVHRTGDAWTLRSADGAAWGPYDTVIGAVPAPQAVPLLAAAPNLAALAGRVTLEPCWALMLAFDRPLDLPYDAARLGDGPLVWIARDASKPGRAGGETWVLHAAPAWSAQHLEADREPAALALLDAFRTVTGIDGPRPSLVAAHRWRHALASKPLGQDCLLEPDLGLGACGDWCLGARIEAAFLSGSAMAGRILSSEGIAGLQTAEEQAGSA